MDQGERRYVQDKRSWMDRRKDVRTDQYRLPVKRDPNNMSKASLYHKVFCKTEKALILFYYCNSSPLKHISIIYCFIFDKKNFHRKEIL